MGLTSLAIRRPLFMLMVISAIVVFGLVSYSRLGVDLNPNVNFPVVSIVTSYPGAGSESVDRLVTRKIEDAVAGINGIDYIRSSSTRGVSQVVVVFKDGVNADTASIEVERKVNAARANLPTEAEAPTIVKADLQAQPVIDLALSGDRPLEELQQIADDQIKDQLAAISGVARVDVFGGHEREVHVQIDDAQLKARGLSVQQVISALGADNMDAPSGKITEGQKDFNIRVDTRYAKPDDLANLIVTQTSTGPIYLRDVATIEDSFKDPAIIQRVNGKESVGIIVVKSADANTIAVTDGVKKAVAQIQAGLPKGTTLDVVLDTSVFIRDSMNSLQRNLVEAVLLTGLVMLIFLHTWRSTLIVLLAIPTSMIATFMVMYILGFTLNQMSMLALALSVGILVDDSIVVLENIFRHLQLGETPWTAALKGRSEIGLAAIAITLVDVVVFVPVAFMSGIVGQFFRQFGLSVAAATLFSLGVSFTLTPLLASRWLKAPKPHHEKNVFDKAGDLFDAGFGKVARGYGWLLRHAIGRKARWLVVLIGILSFVTGIGLLASGQVGSEFFPQSDQSEFTLAVEMPAGTSLEATSAAVKQVEDQLLTWPEVTKIFTTIGRAGGDSPNEPRFATLDVKMVPKTERSRSADAVANAARQLSALAPGMKIRAQMPGGAGQGGQSIQVFVKGADQDELARIAAQVEQIVRSTPGTTDVTNSGTAGQPEVVVTIDRARAADLGLTPGQVASVLRTHVDGTVATKYRPASGDDVDVRVLADKSTFQTVDQIRAIELIGSGGQLVRLGQIADIHEAAAPPQLNRRDRQPLITIGAEPHGRPLGDVSADIQQKLKGIPLPPGYSLQMGGQTQTQNESFAQIFQALGLSVLLMYMLQVALFESLLYPFIILLSLPLSIVGAIGGLWITHNTMNIVSMIGVIMLMGLVGKNAILLVDYTNTLRARGLPRNEALLEAGPTRLRPIAMTTTAMILAMFPLAAGLAEGAEWRAPMAVVIMGGLITSSLLTLVFIPAVYTLFDDLPGGVRKLVRLLLWPIRRLRRRPPSDLTPPSAGGRPEAVDGAVQPRAPGPRVPVGAGYSGPTLPTTLASRAVFWTRFGTCR